MNMKKIMLVCSAGMSTSLLVTKMEQSAKKLGDEVEIFALPMSDGMSRIPTVDCVLLGPQVEVIDMKDYGMMNGEKVYAHAKKLMGA